MKKSDSDRENAPMSSTRTELKYLKGGFIGFHHPRLHRQIGQEKELFGPHAGQRCLSGWSSSLCKTLFKPSDLNRVSTPEPERAAAFKRPFCAGPLEESAAALHGPELPLEPKAILTATPSKAKAPVIEAPAESAEPEAAPVLEAPDVKPAAPAAESPESSIAEALSVLMEAHAGRETAIPMTSVAEEAEEAKAAIEEPAAALPETEPGAEIEARTEPAHAAMSASAPAEEAQRKPAEPEAAAQEASSSKNAMKYLICRKCGTIISVINADRNARCCHQLMETMGSDAPPGDGKQIRAFFL